MAEHLPTTIVNLRHRNADVNCGRGFSIFANPYDHNKLGITRDEACDKYDEYFQKRILTDKPFRDRVLSLEGKKLGCWCCCIPKCNNSKCEYKRCHVQTIVNFINNNKKGNCETP